MLRKCARGRPPKYYAAILAEPRRQLERYFGSMSESAFGIVLSSDIPAIEVALKETQFAEFMDRPAELACIVAKATRREDFPKKYKASQATFLADAIIATDAGTSIRYLRRVFTRGSNTIIQEPIGGDEALSEEE